MKTQLFTVVLIGWDIINQQKFHSKIIKIHACTPNMLFDASNQRKYQKVIQTGVQKKTQNPSKSLKIHLGTFQGPSQCICDPLNGERVPELCPRTSKWNQNGHPRTLRVDENQQAPTTNDVRKVYILTGAALISIL